MNSRTQAYLFQIAINFEKGKFIFAINFIARWKSTSTPKLYKMKETYQTREEKTIKKVNLETDLHDVYDIQQDMAYVRDKIRKYIFVEGKQYQEEMH